MQNSEYVGELKEWYLDCGLFWWYQVLEEGDFCSSQIDKVEDDGWSMGVGVGEMLLRVIWKIKF